MKEVEPRPLNRGWPLYEPPRAFELGSILDCGPEELTDFAVKQALGRHRVGWWECDLLDNSLSWTAGVYEIFGLPDAARITRNEAVALYCEESRAAMERLRNYSIESRRGFVLDAKIRPATGDRLRWMRLIAVPVCEADRSVRLHGLKLWL